MGDDADLTQDGFLGNRLKIRQPRGGHRAGLEAVLLAAAAQPPEGGRVCELGSGAGVATLCAATRRPDILVTGIERDEALVDLAIDNADAHDLGAQVRFCVGDVLAPFAALGETANSYDFVIANPPFYDAGGAPPSTDADRRRAHHGEAGDLEKWVACAAALLTGGGALVFVHRADALDRLLAAMPPRFGDVHVLPVAPRADAPASRILLRARRDGRGALVLLPPLVLHDADGAPSAAAQAVLRDAAPLDFARNGG